MRLFNFVSLLALSAFTSIVDAQTHSECNPMKRDDCSPNPALSGKFHHSFSQTKSMPPGLRKTQQGDLLFLDDGAHLRIARTGESGPQIQSDFFIFYGKLEVRLKAAPGAGIVSSIVLQSDILDEIDWEFVTNKPNIALSNYFGKGDDKTYDRGQDHEVANHMDWHTYTIVWTPESLQWIIDGRVVRTLLPSQTSGHHHYPQSPMQVRIGSWAGGDEKMNEPGTVKWAGGPTDYSKGPFDMAIDYISVEDYSTGKFYRYTDRSGNGEAVVSDGGKINAGAPGGVAPPPVTSKTTTSTTTKPEPPTTTKSTPAPTPDKDDDEEEDSDPTEPSSSTLTTSSSPSPSPSTTQSTTKSGFETTTTKPTDSKPTDTDDSTETDPTPTGAVLPIEKDEDSLAASSFRVAGLGWALVFGTTMAWLL